MASSASHLSVPRPGQAPNLSAPLDANLHESQRPTVCSLLRKSPGPRAWQRLILNELWTYCECQACMIIKGGTRVGTCSLVKAGNQTITVRSLMMCHKREKVYINATANSINERSDVHLLKMISHKQCFILFKVFET